MLPGFVNLFVPDPLPFADEVLMLIATIFIGSFRERRRRPEDERPNERSS